MPARCRRTHLHDARGPAHLPPHVGHIWRKAARQAGVEGFTSHDLRHLTASVLISRGASVKRVQRHLGHTSARTTLDVYSHLWPDDEDGVRAALDEVLGAAVSPVSAQGG